MSKRLEDNLRIYINDLRPEVDTDKVFVTPRSGGISRKYYNSKLKEAVREAGINKSISAHSIRHTLVFGKNS